MAAAALLLAGCGAGAEPQIEVRDAWARATVPGQSATAIYARIDNQGGDDRLLGVAAPGVGTAALHRSSNEGGVAKMRPITDGLPIPAKVGAELRPGGDHIMLTELRAPLRTNATLILRLQFERSGVRTTAVRIVDPATGGGNHGGH